MYKTIILTLDRSSLAEQAIPHAVALGHAFGATIEVVAVVPVVLDQEGLTMGAASLELEQAQFEEYLPGVITRLREEGLTVNHQIRQGDVAEEILRHVDETRAHLIVMSTHGRSGLGRWVYGSIADRVLRHSPVPVLLVRATE